MKRHIILLALVAILLAACGGGTTAPSPTIPPRASASAPTATPGAPRAVIGLFTDPRETHVDEYRSLGPKPSTFPPWDGESTMLYDTKTNTETNLGLGSVGEFSPDSRRMVWIANARPPFNDGDVMLIDIPTGQKRSLGPGPYAKFIDNDHVAISQANASISVDLRTGEHGAPPTPLPAPYFPDITTPDGYVLHRVLRSAPPFLKNSWYLSDASGKPVLQFEAYLAMPAGRGTLAVETVPELTGTPDIGGRQGGTANIFLVDIASGRATFVATSGGTQPYWQVDANDGYIVWPEDYCGGGEGHTRLYDRRTGKISQFGAASNPRFTPGGLLLVGTYYGVESIDPETLTYRTAIPSRGDTSWSPDYRYASIGLFSPHGGECM